MSHIESVIFSRGHKIKKKMLIFLTFFAQSKNGNLPKIMLSFDYVRGKKYCLRIKFCRKSVGTHGLDPAPIW
jgi:hypothetical protein